MGYPVKILIDGFEYLRERIPKGEIFDAPTLYLQGFLEKEGTGKPCSARGRVPASKGSYRLVNPPGKYKTRKLEAGGPVIETEEVTSDESEKDTES